MADEPTTANQAILDAQVRHQIALQGLTKGTQRRVLALLDRSEAELRRRLEKALAAMPGGQVLTLAQRRRLTLLRAAIADLRSSATDRAFSLLASEMQKLVGQEADFAAQSIEAASPAQVSLATPPTAQLTALVSTQPFQGNTLAGWAKSVKAADLRRIDAAIQMGMTQGEPIPQIVRRVMGAGGATTATRRNAEAIVRTAVNHYSNKAKELTYLANSDIVDEELYVATLDARTTPQCQALDGRRFPLGKGPRPPVHFNCRSLRVAVIDGQVVGERPAKPATERMLVREFAAKQKLEGVSRRDQLPRGTRGAYDEFARKRMRQLTGTVPAKTSYDQWLRTQSKEFQDDVLGRGRAKLFRDGAKLDRFVDRSGRGLTLDQLKAKSTGDVLNVTQPGLGQKAKALLQQGYSNQEVVDKIKAEYPDAGTTAASVASYKVELKKAGLLGELSKGTPMSQLGMTIDGSGPVHVVAKALEAGLPQGLKAAVGGKWLSVADDLTVPGAFAHYEAGKGVLASAKALGKVSAEQAKQVLAHELGHMLHKQHGVELPPDVFHHMKLTAKGGLGSYEEKLYSYYLSSPDELVGEVYAQALSPSPLTSQGLSAKVFSEAFAEPIAAAKKAIADQFPDVTPAAAHNAALAPTGAPVSVGEVVGGHHSIGSLSKALLQQGVPDDDVLKIVKEKFPHAQTTKASLASYKVELKKKGLLPTKASGPVAQPVKAMAPPKPTMDLTDITSLAKTVSEQPSVPNLPGLKDAGLNAKGLPKANPVTKSYAQTLGWASQEHADALALANKLSAQGVDLHKISTALNAYADDVAVNDRIKIMAVAASKYHPDPAVKAIAAKQLKDLFPAAAPKPYVPPAPYVPPESTSVKASKAVLDKVQPKAGGIGPADSPPPPQYFTDEQRRAGLNVMTGGSPSDPRGLQAFNKSDAVREPLTADEYSALKSYTGHHYHSINRALRDDGFRKGNVALQAYVELTRSAMAKIKPYQGDWLNRGMSIYNKDQVERVLSVYRVGQTFEEAAFVSTSTASGFGGNFRLRVKSKTGVPVETLSHYRGEREVLFAPGTKFRVTRVTKTGDNAWSVEVEEV